MTDSNTLRLWGLEIPSELLTDKEKSYLKKWQFTEFPTLEQIWNEMDSIWDTFALDNSRPLNQQCVEQFYEHPIWLLNGIFVHLDPVSQNHRRAMAKKISNFNPKRVADFGGGFGELARHLALIAPHIYIDIIEPFPTKLAKFYLSQYPNVRFTTNFEGIYNCVVAQDVLEHMEQPLKLVEKMVRATSIGGVLIFANCFYPVIKCHLPSTFHLRHTFPWVIKPLGLEYCGRIKGAYHALVFQRKTSHLKWDKCSKRERISKKLGPIINQGISILAKIKKKIRFLRHFVWI